jgi:hypothetical protein
MIALASLVILSLDKFSLLAGLGAFAGLILFYYGFRLLQRKRLIQNTPMSRIRSASLGLVEVNGLAVGPFSMTAPITAKPCFYYRTQAWELRRSGKNEEWTQVADESLHVPFFLDDNTGRLLIDPQGAQMDIHRDFHQEYSNSIFAGTEMPERVRAFLTRNGISSDRKIRIDEYCIKPKNALFALGTLAERLGPRLSARPILTQHAALASVRLNVPGGSGKKIGLSLSTSPSMNMTSMSLELMRDLGNPRENANKEIIFLSPERGPATAAQMTQQGKIAAALLKAGINSPAAWSAAGIDDPASAIATASVAEENSSTTANPAASDSSQPFDLQPKVVLKKGENNSAFLISWRSQQKIINSMGWKSAACIWGGPALTLTSVYLLLAHLGWL